MNTVQQTAYAIDAMIYKLFDIQPDIDPFSTMNERLGILANERPMGNERIKLGILVAGNLGHRNVQGSGGIGKTDINQHLANHASLYNPMPFCMRPVEQDIPLSQRVKYALRGERAVPGLGNFYTYYGYRLQVAPGDISIEKFIVTTVNGVETSVPFVPGQSDLFPTPIPLPNVGAVTTSDVKIKVRAIVQVKFSALDIEEYVNVAKILYGGDEGYAIWSEFGLCTGADRQITVPSSSGAVNFLESIGTQIYNFSADHRPVYYNQQELSIEFDIGNSLPLLGTASIPTLNVIS